MLAERVRAKGLQLSVQAEVPPLHLLGDPTRLQQALLNYAANAVKFTEKGSITLHCKVLEERSDQLLMQFSVRDSGIGIAAEALPRLFAAFEQADNSTTRQYGGTGLGLAIVRKLAEAMGGEAGVETEIGVGSTFWFSAWLKKGEPGPRVVSAWCA